MNDELRETLNRLAVTHRILEMEGHGDMTQGHLSLRDPAGQGFWLKRHGIGLGEVTDNGDFIHLDFDGRKIAGGGQRHSEWPIHSEIFKRRPEIAVIGHTHPFYASIFSATAEDVRPVGLDGARLPTPISHYKGSAELVHTVGLGGELADALGAACAVLMGNHGVTFVGRSVEEALVIAISLERACQSQLLIAASGYAWHCPDTQAVSQRRSSIADHQAKGLAGFHRQTWDYYRRKLAWAERNNAPGSTGYFRL